MMKTKFLRMLPYVMALMAGLLLFLVAEFYFKEGSLNDLIMNISAGLLSVPIIFIFYEIVKERCNVKVTESIVEHLYFELNHHVLKISLLVGKLVQLEQLDEESVVKFLQLGKDELKGVICSNAELANDFIAEKREINQIIRNGSSL